ncbi:uncharacterized protein LOC134227111 [Armigeres subalbatus]|uniref:uncharacterized protein LOC134227111 n=1 Tax=Armigeres subalbatus TaxID=124917 RepID=UPI002ED49F3B
MTPSCVICNDSQQKNSQCRLFPFPDPSSQAVQFQKYLAVCDLQEQCPQTDNLHICSTHFSAECIDQEGNLIEGAMPTTNLERIEIETYADEDFQMLEEYEPLFNVKSKDPESVSAVSLTSSIQPSVMETETLLVPKTEPVEEAEENVTFVEAEIKTEAPDVDEGIPDPFGNVTAADSVQESDPKYCILCGDRESKNSNCRLYIFPKKIPKIYRKWMLAARLDMTRYQDKDIYSCQKHFPENGFFADGKFIQSWASPKLNLPARLKTVAPSLTKPTEPQVIFLNEPGPSSSGATRSTGPQIVIKSNPANRKNAEALNIDPDSYAKTFAKVVMELMPRKLNYNGEERPVTGTIVFQSNLF